MMTSRRQFISLLGCAAAAWPVAARAQQGNRVRRVAVLMGVSNDAQGQARLEAFTSSLERAGWAEGRDVLIDCRWSGGAPDRMRTLAKELVELNPDVVLANSDPAVTALQRVTSTIPIVGVQIAIDPVSAGFVRSVARPGGNITGFTLFEKGMGGKWLQILKQIAPNTLFAGSFLSSEILVHADLRHEIAAAASSFKMRSTSIEAVDATQIERAIVTIARQPKSGLIVLPSPLHSNYRELIIRLAAEHRLPTVYPVSFYAKAGGLVSYGADNIDLYRRAASYVNRILKGEKPADLPVQAPTQYELVINLKTAKAFVLDVPPMLLAIADEVIE